MLKNNLKRVRELRKLTQNDLAELAETKQSYISELEAGKKIPSLQMLERIAKALGICTAILIIDESNSCNNCLTCMKTEGITDEK